jgi:uncharacterized membrane protein
MMRSAFFAVLLLLSAPFASADTISDINLKINGNGFTWVEERFIFESEGDYGLIAYPGSAGDFAVYDDRGNLTYEVADIDGIKAIKVNLREPLTLRKTAAVWLRYGTLSLTSKVGDNWTFAYGSPTTPRKTIVRVTYPIGSRIFTIKPSELLRTYVDEGVWVYPQETELNFTTTYQFAGEGGSEAATTTTLRSANPPSDEMTLLLGMIVVFVVLVAAVAAYGFFKAGRRSKASQGGHLTVNVADDVVSSPKVVDGKVSYDLDATASARGIKAVKESVVKVLDENELAIVRLLENADEDEVTQAYIYKTTGIPKSSLSDILKHIEKRNIIERRVDGRVKWIKLKTWVLD